MNYIGLVYYFLSLYHNLLFCSDINFLLQIHVFNIFNKKTKTYQYRFQIKTKFSAFTCVICFSSSILAANMRDKEPRHAELKISFIIPDFSARTRRHTAIRSTSSSVIGWSINRIQSMLVKKVHIHYALSKPYF